MIRFILCLLMIFTVAQTASASGKLTVQNNFGDGLKFKPMVGFGIYEPIFKKVALNAWSGYGHQPLEIRGDVNWWLSKAQADIQVARFTVSPGVQYKVLMGDISDKELSGYLRVDYKLW